jgi:hypothetical protein
MQREKPHRIRHLAGFAGTRGGAARVSGRCRLCRNPDAKRRRTAWHQACLQRAFRRLRTDADNMNLFTGESADEFFGGAVPDAVRRLLHEAAQAPRGEVGALLWTAQALAPQCLPVYYALYKHHAGRREFERAERAARRGLQEAARAAGLDADWRRVVPASLPAGLDFGANGAARFWLFTLKALAFIALRSQRPAEARELLARIGELGRGERIGDEVIATLLAQSGGSPP